MCQVYSKKKRKEEKGKGEKRKKKEESNFGNKDPGNVTGYYLIGEQAGIHGNL